MSAAPENARILQLLALHAQNNDAFSSYALALEYKKLGAFPEAIQWFEKTLQIDGHYLAVFYQLGQLYVSLKQLEQALSVFDRGIELAMLQQDVKTLAELKNARMNAELEAD